MSVVDLLDAVAPHHPTLQLDWRAGVINVLDSELSGFLETRLESVELTDPAANPMLAVCDVLTSRASLQAAASLHLESDWFSAVRRERWKYAGGVADKIVWRQITVREALNAIAQTQGSGQWEYFEFNTSGGTRTFGLNLILQAHPKR